MLIDRRLLVRAAEADNVVVGTDEIGAAYKKATSGLARGGLRRDLAAEGHDDRPR